NIWCAVDCQADTPHTMTKDANSEIVCECTVCKSFIKLPAGWTPDQMAEHLVLHRAANQGKVKIEVVNALHAQTQAALDEFLGRDDSPPVVEPIAIEDPALAPTAEPNTEGQ